MNYRTLRTIHLLCGALAVPFLLMYGISAVQMAHNKWFVMKPAIAETNLTLPGGFTDGRAVARAVMDSRGIAGEINQVQQTPDGFNVRLVVPGTVHEIRYQSATGATRVRTSVAGFMGMMNRMHHAAGLWPSYLPLWLWGAAIGVVSLATLGLGATGIWMWWSRKKDRVVGMVLLSANLIFAIVIMALLRSNGP